MKAPDRRVLLTAYARDLSESAFRELVGRYVGLVYATAFRRVGGNRALGVGSWKCISNLLRAEPRNCNQRELNL